MENVDLMQKLVSLLPYFGIAVLGAVAHIFAKLAKLEKKKSFKFSIWRQKNTYSTLLSIMLSLAGVLTLDAMGGLSMMAVFFMAYSLDSATKNGNAAKNL